MTRIDWVNHLINFFVVLFSVFLAFYLTEEAESWEEKAELKEILSALVEDMDSDQQVYDTYQLPRNEAHAEDLGHLIRHLTLGKKDSAEALIESAMTVENYSPASSTYLSIKNSGKLELIEDLKVRKHLSRYYDMYSEEARVRGQVQADYLLDVIIPLMVQHGDMVRQEAGGLIEEKRFANCMVFYQSLVENKLNQYEKLTEMAGELKSVLEEMQNDL